MAVYLLHLDSPLAHAGHYIGFCSSAANVTRRLAHHRSGNGARFTQVCNERGIGYEIARIWKDGTREFERRLKQYKKTRRFCPLCNPRTAENCMKGES